jgi:hypothetical protein
VLGGWRLFLSVFFFFFFFFNIFFLSFLCWRGRDPSSRVEISISGSNNKKKEKKKVKKKERKKKKTAAERILQQVVALRINLKIAKKSKVPPAARGRCWNKFSLSNLGNGNPDIHALLCCC